MVPGSIASADSETKAWDILDDSVNELRLSSDVDTDEDGAENVVGGEVTKPLVVIVFVVLFFRMKRLV